MIIKNRTEKEIEQGRKFIGLVGSRRLINLGGFTAQNLTGWKTRGIPKSWMLLFRVKFPREFKKCFIEETENE